MPYALFSHADQVSNAFRSKAEVWEHAAASGLVIELGSSEEDPPRRVLDMGFVIRECAAVAPAVRDESSMSEHDVAQMIAGSRVSQPSAAAAS